MRNEDMEKLGWEIIFRVDLIKPKFVFVICISKWSSSKNGSPFYNNVLGRYQQCFSTAKKSWTGPDLHSIGQIFW